MKCCVACECGNGHGNGGVTPPPAGTDYGGFFPAAQGFASGSLTCQPVGEPNIGGRGGAIYLVDTLEDRREAPRVMTTVRKRHPRVAIRGHMGKHGEANIAVEAPKLLADTTIYRSTLRTALEANEPRSILSEVGGNIVLDASLGGLKITNPYCTLALQTAPSPGITIIGQLQITTHDVFVRHFRVRFPSVTGTLGSSSSIPLVVGGSANDTWNVMVDHVSLAFAPSYMTFASVDHSGSRPNPWDINLSNSLIAFPLTSSDDYYQGYGSAFWTVGNGQFTAHRNLLVHSSHRNFNSGNMKCQHVANRIYGSGPDDGWLVYSIQAHSPQIWSETDPKYRTNGVFEANHFYPSYGTGSGDTEGTRQGHHSFNMQFSRDNVYVRGDRIYLKGNAGPFITGPDGAGQYAGIYFQQDEFTQSELMVNEPFPWHAQMEMQTDWNDAKVGARPTDRDATDRLAIQQYQAGTVLDTPNMGSRIRSCTDLGIDIYDVPQTRRALELPDDPNAIADEFGRTNLEVWLNDQARLVEG